MLSHARYAARFAFYTARLLVALPRTETKRREGPFAPAEAPDEAPDQSVRECADPDDARAPDPALLRAAACVDRVAPGPRNCYRRALLMKHVDPELALRVGFRFEGPQVRGHAWIVGDVPRETYDVVIDLE